MPQLPRAFTSVRENKRDLHLSHHRFLKYKLFFFVHEEFTSEIFLNSLPMVAFWGSVISSFDFEYLCTFACSIFLFASCLSPHV